MGFIAEICLTLTVYIKEYSGLTVDYGENFKLTVDFILTKVANRSTECEWETEWEIELNGKRVKSYVLCSKRITTVYSLFY